MSERTKSGRSAPDEIADTAWRMYVARDEAEAVFDAITASA
jgi:hypothetical protein